MDIKKNFKLKDVVILIMGIIIIVLGVKSCDNEKPVGTQIVNKNEDFKNDNPLGKEINPNIHTNWNNTKDDKSKEIELDTVRRKFYIVDTIRHTHIDTIDYSFIINNPLANKLLQLDLSYKKLDLTLQDKTSKIFTDTYNLDLHNYKYRYIQGKGLSKSRDIFGRQHFEDHLIIDHDWYLNSTTIYNELQYKTSRIIIKGSIGLDYNHHDKNIGLNLKTGIGYKLF